MAQTKATRGTKRTPKRTTRVAATRTKATRTKAKTKRISTKRVAATRGRQQATRRTVPGLALSRIFAQRPCPGGLASALETLRRARLIRGADAAFWAEVRRFRNGNNENEYHAFKERYGYVEIILRPSTLGNLAASHPDFRQYLIGALTAAQRTAFENRCARALSPSVRREVARGTAERRRAVSAAIRRAEEDIRRLTQDITRYRQNLEALGTEASVQEAVQNFVRVRGGWQSVINSGLMNAEARRRAGNELIEALAE